MPGTHFSIHPILLEWHALNEFWFAIHNLWLLAVPISLSMNTAWFLHRSYSSCKMLAVFNWERQANICHKELSFSFLCMRNSPTLIISSHSKHQMLHSSNAALMCLCSNLSTEWLLLLLLLVLTPWGNTEWPGYELHSIEWLGYGLNNTVTRLWAAQHRVTRLWAAQPRNCSLVPSRDKMLIIFAQYLYWLWGPSLFIGHQRLCPQVKWPGCAAYRSPPSCAKIKISGAILTPPPQYTFMTCTGAVLLWPLSAGKCQELSQIRPWLLPSRTFAGLYLPLYHLTTDWGAGSVVRCWQCCGVLAVLWGAGSSSIYHYINCAIEGTFGSSFIKSWSGLLSQENVLPDRVQTFLLFLYMPCWDEERSLAPCLVCYQHLSVCQIPTQYGAKHKNILPSPVPSDIADGGTLSNINRHFHPSVTFN
jgi:hypothetical protein